MSLESNNKSIERQKKIVKFLCEYLPAFPDCKLDKKGLLVYADVLWNYETSIACIAIRKAVRHCRTFPTIADIVEEADRLNDKYLKDIPEEKDGELFSDAIKRELARILRDDEKPDDIERIPGQWVD